MENDFNMKIVENNFTIKIEGKAYHIYESYIKNGTGYTFRIYVTAKHRKERENCFWSSSYNNIVIVGKEYNYMLIRKKDCFEFDIIKYNKEILRLDIEVKLGQKYPYMSYSIKLNENVFIEHGSDSDNNLWEKESELRKKKNRKEKLIKINNE